MGDHDLEPPVAKKAKLAENSDEEDASMAKIFLSLDVVQDKLLQHQEVVEQKIALLKAKMRELATPLYAERRQLTAKIPGFWTKAVCSPISNVFTLLIE
jgi:surfactin synthase thioesterase subunit